MCVCVCIYIYIYIYIYKMAYETYFQFLITKKLVITLNWPKDNSLQYGPLDAPFRLSPELSSSGHSLFLQNFLFIPGSTYSFRCSQKALLTESSQIAISRGYVFPSACSIGC
jgi:hypothetical protein